MNHTGAKQQQTSGIKLHYRAITFFVVAILLLLRSHAILRILNIHNYEWYVPFILAITFALIFSFYPVTSSRSLSLIAIAPLGVILVIELALGLALVIAICVVELSLAISLFAGIGYFLIVTGYKMHDTVGASVATIIFITILLLVGRRSLTITQQAIKGTGDIARDIGGAIAGWWFPYPLRLIKKIWDFATRLGETMGGNIKLSR